RAQYEKVLGEKPGAAEASWRLAALYADQNTNLGVALNLAIAAKQQLPEDPSVSDALGWVYAQQNLPASGLTHLQDAVRGAPQNPVFRYHLGTAYMRARSP